MNNHDYRKEVPRDSLGIYMKEIAAFSRLSPAEEKAVARRARDGDETAFRQLVEANLRFVVAMAKKYARSGYPMHELINEGNLGLIEAARRFDPDRDVRFVTYASWWIRQAILAAIAHYGQVFSIPPKLKHELYRFESSIGRLTQELGHRPSVEEISEELSMPEEEVRGMMGRVPSEVSLSAPLGDEGDFHVEDLISDPNIAPADKALITRSFHRQLRDLLSQLDERERLVVEHRFGLGGTEPETLAELGEHLGLSRERVRQIEARALEKLRRSQRVHQLMGYLN
jgi:RNA polymerase primary sigma factor